MVYVIAILGFLGLVVVNLLLSGWVLSVLWGWFIVPAFGLPALSITTALGLALVVRYLTSQAVDCDDKRPADEKLKVTSARLILTPLIALILGWCIHTFF